MIETALSNAIRRTAEDRRADDGRRTVTIGQTTILIERLVQGVKMRVAVPVATYVGVVLARRAAPSRDHAIVLSHRDPELCVEIDAAGDAATLAGRLEDWARYFGKPAETTAARHTFTASRGIPAGRRPRFLTRRKPGLAARSAIVFRDEAEIISYE